MYEQLKRGEARVSELLTKRNDRWYPRFHIAGLAGWLNDPNGMSYYHGRYHVYFQHHPFGTDWGPMHWGHVSSPDMVHWRHEPIAMAPSIDADRDGVFSGSAITSDTGRLVAFYTGHRWRNGVNDDKGAIQVQCMAVSDDGVTFDKLGTVVDCPNGLAHFRDPCVWRAYGRWFMAVGACSDDNRGEIWLYESSDLISWKFERVLFRDPDPDTFMIECPDIFPLGDKWVIVYCPMGRSPNGYQWRNAHNAGYVVGWWQPGRGFVSDTYLRPLDWGANFYAPQSFSAPDGRRIQLGWMGAFDRQLAPAADDGWSGQMTVHRELTLGEDNSLIARPIDELRRLRTETTELGPINFGDNISHILCANADAFEIELDVDLATSTAERFGVAVGRTEDGHETLIGYDDLTDRVFLDRHRTAHGDRGYRSAPRKPGHRLRLQIFVDRGSVEVFIDGGASTLSSLAFPSAGPRAVGFFTESGTVDIVSLRIHRMGTMWTDADTR